MPAASYWKALVWTHFASPKCDRALYRRVQELMPERIVELGIGDLTRTTRVIALAQRRNKVAVRYCGIDLFETRPQSTLKLKDAHHRLSRTGAKIRLVPGDLMPAMTRAANLLIETDLLIIDAGHSLSDLASVSRFLPRMLHAATTIARYDFRDGRSQLRWVKPSAFQRTIRRAA